MLKTKNFHSRDYAESANVSSNALFLRQTLFFVKVVELESYDETRYRVTSTFLAMIAMAFVSFCCCCSGSWSRNIYFCIARPTAFFPRLVLVWRAEENRGFREWRWGKATWYEKYSLWVEVLLLMHQISIFKC